MRDITWMTRAACRGYPLDWWFPNKLWGDQERKFERAETMVAKAFCEACPVAVECLAWAIRNKDQDGIFGGLDPKERRSLVRKEREMRRAG